MARFQYQVKAEPLVTGAGVPTLDRWKPEYPAIIVRAGVPIQQIWPTLQDQIADVPSVAGWIGSYPAVIPRSVFGTALQAAYAANLDPIPNAPLDLGWAALHPDWLPAKRLPDLSFFVQPIAPTTVIPPPRLGLHAFTADILEETSGTYTTILVDEIGRPISVGVLTSLRLTLYVRRSTGTHAFLRQAQDVLNTNGVALSGLLTRRDGRQYNLKWSVTTADTTMVEDLPFERHIALFEYAWGDGKAGKHEIVINVKRVREVH